MAVETQAESPLYRPPPAFDLLNLPVIGPLLRWRWGRLVFQIPLLAVAGLIIYDGLTGPQLAPENTATVLAWIHYRGLVVLALLLAGNLFCMGCPFTLPRTLARKLSLRGRRWPKALRNKWLAIGLLFLIFFLYEWLDLWASPRLTAWLAVAYFVAAFALEALFAESAFCKYVCPLGSFNFVSSTISPLQIAARDMQVCRTCVNKECVTGSAETLGCGTELFVPQITSNLDCVFCLDCARACPHNNVALVPRAPLRELAAPDSWRRRWDLGFLALVFAFASLSNAFGMVPPVYELEILLAERLRTNSEAVVLLLIFGGANLVLPAVLGLGAARLSQVFTGPAKRESLRAVFARYAPAVIPLAFGVWLAHYGFHFATGALTIVPVFQNFLLDHRVSLLGAKPDWTLGAILPFSWLLPLQTVILLAGLAGSLYVVGERHRRARPHPPGPGFAAMLPWVVLFLALTVTAAYLFSLPMEMRGTVQFLY